MIKACIERLTFWHGWVINMQPVKTLTEFEYESLETLLRARIKLVTDYQRYKDMHRRGQMRDELAVKIGRENEYRIAKSKLDNQINILTNAP